MALLRSLFCSLLFGHASSTESIRQWIVRLVTRVLVELPTNLGDGQFPRPRFGPHSRIFHGELVEDRVFVGAREPLDHMQILSSPERAQISEIGRVDHQRIGLPMTDRVAIPLADAFGYMRAAVRGNDPNVVDL